MAEEAGEPNGSRGSGRAERVPVERKRAGRTGRARLRLRLRLRSRAGLGAWAGLRSRAFPVIGEPGEPQR